MIITISGKAGSGKSSVAKLLAKKIGLSHYSIGDLMRQMASEKKISLLELNSLAESDKSIDKQLDEKLKQLGLKKDNFVIDGRLTAFFIPHAQFRIFLDADDNERASRIMKDNRVLEKNTSHAETLRDMDKREKSEIKRYQKYYGINYLEKSLYNCVIDTTNLPLGQVVENIISFINAKK